MLKERAHLAVKLSALVVNSGRTLTDIVDILEMFDNNEINEIERLARLWKP
jgi:hypothetical protein